MLCGQASKSFVTNDGKKVVVKYKWKYLQYFENVFAMLNIKDLHAFK